jgi:hypothetical protein
VSVNLVERDCFPVIFIEYRVDREKKVCERGDVAFLRAINLLLWHKRSVSVFWVRIKLDSITGACAIGTRSASSGVTQTLDLKDRGAR